MSGTRREPVVEIIGGIAKVPRAAWNALLAEGESPFLDWDWLWAMEQSGSATRRTGWTPSHLVVRESKGEGRLLAAAPLYVKSHSMGEFVFDHGWAEAAEEAGLRYFPKLLVGVPFTPHTGRRFLTAAEADRPELVELMGRALIAICTDNKLSSAHVNFCDADEAAALARLGFLERLGCQYHWRNHGFTSFEDYLNRLKHKRRYTVRHERAALAAQGVTIQVFAGEAIPDSMFPAIFEIYRSTIDKLYWGRQYLTAEFFDLMRTNFKRHLCIVAAFRGRELIAGTFNLQKAGVLYGRYWGCFEELKYLHFNVCYYAAIEHCIAGGLQRFEPGAGGEYKWLRGFDPSPTRSMHYLSHRGLHSAVAKFLTRERRQVEAWIAAGNQGSQLKAAPPPGAQEEPG